MKYRELGLKEKLKDVNEDEMLEILSSDGMLIKRPLITNGSQLTVGFKEDQLASTWLSAKAN